MSIVIRENSFWHGKLLLGEHVRNNWSNQLIFAIVYREKKQKILDIRKNVKDAIVVRIFYLVFLYFLYTCSAIG